MTPKSWRGKDYVTHFYPLDVMLARYLLSSRVYLSVCPSQVEVALYKNGQTYDYANNAAR